MKKKNLFMLVMLITTMGICSCSKDDDDSSSQGSNGFRPGARVEGKVTVGGRTYTRTVGGTVGNAVDLGLPSGTLWASHNIGASQPEEYGAYLAWGEVGAKEEGYVNGIKYYAWSTTKYCNGTSSSWSKYVASSSYGTVDDKTVLEAMDDAATVNWGEGWRMPTTAELAELRTKCTWTWVTTDVKDSNGDYIKGRKVTGPNGNSIFLPAAGRRVVGSLVHVGSIGYYWSSSLYTFHSSDAYVLNFSSSGVLSNNSRDCGQSVRPVRSE